MEEQSKKIDPKTLPYTEGIFGRPDSDMPDSQNNYFTKILNGIKKSVDGPVTFVRENIVEKLKPEPPVYYHQNFRRVPTVDECYTDDLVCIHEANEQYKRDRSVDDEIVSILKKRAENCVAYHGRKNSHKCDDLKKDYDEALENRFIKYGDLTYGSVIDCYMKQKHRLIMDRRKEEAQKN